VSTTRRPTIHGDQGHCVYHNHHPQKKNPSHKRILYQATQHHRFFRFRIIITPTKKKSFSLSLTSKDIIMSRRPTIHGDQGRAVTVVLPPSYDALYSIVMSSFVMNEPIRFYLNGKILLTPDNYDTIQGGTYLSLSLCISLSLSLYISLHIYIYKQVIRLWWWTLKEERWS
jgi:hypothetical protein